MPTWFLLALVAAILYGAHQVFTRDAAGRIEDGWGALVLEASACAAILIYALVRRQPPAATARGVVSATAAGVCAGIGTVLFFILFRLGAPLSAAGPIVVAGGVAVMAVAGVIAFGEPLAVTRVVGLALAVAGIALMRT